MKTDINKVFNKYFEIYTRIFEEFYPAEGSNGFTEQNQSVNLSKAFESIYPDSFSWFELPMKREHIDVIIVNPSKKEIFIIEAKRFSLLKKKIKSIAFDIIRTSKAKDFEIFNKDSNGKRFKDYTFYGLVLADIWTETANKIKVFENWGKGFFSKTKEISVLEDFEYEDIEKILDKAEWSYKDFINAPNISGCIKENYKLLMLLWKIQ